MVPQFIDKKLGVTIPVGLETVILIFIFSAEILGEINAFYVKIPIWDTILHTTNGFLMAAIGFALIDLFNRSDRFSIKMSPYFVAFFAFCFSMTVGVMWGILLNSAWTGFLEWICRRTGSYRPSTL